MCGKEEDSKEGKGSGGGSFSNGLKIGISFITILICYFYNGQMDGGIFIQLAGLLLFLIGGTIVALGALALGENFTLSHHPKGLVTKGIFSKIRHPMDYGGILLSIGFAIFLLSLYGLIMALVLVAPLHIYSIVIENGIMMEKYGNEYRKYKERTLF
jgi:protein-S-isoprenylcysteine O-methyltransferase Ste14